jgi:tetratricopeptide (TPR) repeat protein
VQKEYQKAIIAYEKAIELGQGHPDYYNNLALCYRELGDVKKAKDTFYIGLKRYPDSELLRKNAEQTRQIINK